jgi:uncharacterized protein (TIGR00375 family)
MIINADLHIHGRYSLATSKNMVPDVIAPQARLKGLDLVGTGDALHYKWLQILNETIEETESGIFSIKHENRGEDENSGCKFILTVEVEDIKRVHHLVLIPSFDAAYGLREEIRGNLDSDGRPKVHMNGGEIMDLSHEHGCLAGPSHAFTPWTSIYKEYDSLCDCYGKKPDFLELGLSADNDMADHIKELQDIPFLSNSDAHSPWPHRLGREFNEIEVKELAFKDVTESILKKNIKANYGFNPRLGKYHKTGCARCYKVFDIEEALALKMKCPCGGIIKKGVDYRIHELSTWNEPHHPSYRPPYIHILPLAEIISLIYDKGVTTVSVQKIWKELVEKFENEITVLIYTPLEDLETVDPQLVPIIKAFRNNTLQIQPGGGGRYGKILFEQDEQDISDDPADPPSHDTLDKYF